MNVFDRLYDYQKDAVKTTLFNNKGIICMPTGVGKTTTTAKLAARAVVRYGADKVALITTDSYRIGAHGDAFGTRYCALDRGRVRSPRDSCG